MASGITLSAGVRQNLLSLQQTGSLMATTQNRLASGKKVNSALDNPTNFFTSASLQSRSNDLGSLLDSMSNGIKTLEAPTMACRENTIERTVVLTRADQITLDDIPEEIVTAVKESPTIPVGDRVLNIPIGKIPLKEIERMVMEETLKQSKGDKNIASKLLGISTRTIYRRLDEEEEEILD